MGNVFTHCILKSRRCGPESNCWPSPCGKCSTAELLWARLSEKNCCFAKWAANNFSTIGLASSVPYRWRIQRTLKWSFLCVQLKSVICNANFIHEQHAKLEITVLCTVTLVKFMSYTLINKNRTTLEDWKSEWNVSHNLIPLTCGEMVSVFIFCSCRIHLLGRLINVAASMENRRIYLVCWNIRPAKIQSVTSLI